MSYESRINLPDHGPPTFTEGERRNEFWLRWAMRHRVEVSLSFDYKRVLAGHIERNVEDRFAGLSLSQCAAMVDVDLHFTIAPDRAGWSKHGPNYVITMPSILEESEQRAMMSRWIEGIEVDRALKVTLPDAPKKNS